MTTVLTRGTVVIDVEACKGCDLCIDACPPRLPLTAEDIQAELDRRRDGGSIADLIAQPRRLLTTPYWTGITNGNRTYAAYCQNIEELIPWRTLTGRQHLYLDHEAYIAFGES